MHAENVNVNKMVYQWTVIISFVKHQMNILRPRDDQLSCTFNSIYDNIIHSN